MQNASESARGTASYFAEIRRFPMLKADEEHMLAERWHQCGDSSAAHLHACPDSHEYPGRYSGRGACRDRSADGAT